MVSGIFTPLKVALNLKSLIKRFINQGRYVKTGQRNNGAAVYRNTNSDARVLYRNGDGTWAASNRVADGVLGAYMSVESVSCPTSIQRWNQIFSSGRLVTKHGDITVTCDVS